MECLLRARFCATHLIHVLSIPHAQWAHIRGEETDQTRLNCLSKGCRTQSMGVATQLFLAAVLHPAATRGFFDYVHIDGEPQECPEAIVSDLITLQSNDGWGDWHSWACGLNL